jgi:hypothetical protein|tara:strand:+ start:96 stop:290 length:195 start_codon:yes stop_codon:yes gene_type:complete
MLYQTLEEGRSYSGEIESDEVLVLIDELTCEDLPFKVVRRELNKEFLFLGHKGLLEFNLNENEL